eukprot:gb/GECG01011471.1/.p1 GENE.gb/GECG01011471.1/~~gb/GECG01011471.1/.p1  ORF type:complete len:1153 (+),score=86.81 gb/GECG01011471.1/:1-3459(+)
MDGPGPERRTKPSMLTKFKHHRQRSSRKFAFRLSVRVLVAWVIYLTLTLVPLVQDELTQPLLPYLYATKAVLTSIMLTFPIFTRLRYFEKTYSNYVSAATGAFIVVHFSEGVIVDILVRQHGFYGAEANSAAVVIASRVLGPHQLLFLVSVLASSRIMVIDTANYLRLLLIAPSICTLIVLFQALAVGGVSYIGLGTADYLRSVIVVIASIFVNYYIALLEEHGQWQLWVQRKRVQLGCIQAEALLKLTMPRETAHEQLRGAAIPKTYDNTTVGFIYFSGYSSLMKSLQEEKRLDLVQFLDFLIGKLDQLVVEFPEVYKIESIGNCYMVSSGAPFITDRPAERALDFLLEAIQLYNVLRVDYNPEPWREFIEQLTLQCGVHSGRVTAGVIGKTCRFYRLFGDTVNVASRIASKCSNNRVLASENFISSLGLKNAPESDKRFSRTETGAQFAVSGYGLANLKGKGMTYLYYLQDEHAIQGKNGITHDPEQLANSASRVKPMTTSFSKGMATMTSATTLSENRDSKRSIRRTQYIIAETSQLLGYSLDQSLTSYGRLPEPEFLHEESFFIKELETLILSRFVNSRHSASRISDSRHGSTMLADSEKFCIEVGHGMKQTSGNSVARPSTSSSSSKTTNQINDTRHLHPPVRNAWIIDQTFLPTAPRKANDSYCHCLQNCKYLGLLRAGFLVPEMESEYENSIRGLNSDLLQRLGGFGSLFLLYTSGIYFNSLEHVTVSSIIISGLVLVIVFLRSYSLIALSTVRTQEDSKNTAPQRPFSEGLRLLVGRANSSDETGDHQFERTKRRLRFKAYAFIVLWAWLVIITLSAMDHIAWSRVQNARPTSELCLETFLYPVFLLPAFHVFRLGLQKQLLIQIGGMFGVIPILFLASESLPCSGYIIALGFLFVSNVVVNGIMDAADGELRLRRSVVLNRAFEECNNDANGMISGLFPPSVARNLRNGKSIPLRFVPNNVAILWADLVGFTALASNMDSFVSMELLNDLYSRFDVLLEYESLWKMDTIGDAYVVVGSGEEQHEASLVSYLFQTAQGMIRAIEDFKSDTGYDVGVRIGIGAGPAVWGVLGTLRPRFHVFGEAVLEAEEMEGTARTNEIRVSQNAANIYWQHQFQFRQSSGYLALAPGKRVNGSEESSTCSGAS